MMTLMAYEPALGVHEGPYKKIFSTAVVYAINNVGGEGELSEIDWSKFDGVFELGFQHIKMSLGRKTP